MVDTSKIHTLISRARWRLRLQAALETATTASIIAIAGALAVVYAIRQGVVDDLTGMALLVGCAAVVAVGALIGGLGRFPTHIVATRIDRASNLADRLSSACAFEGQLGGVGDAETEAFMRAAIRDAVAAAPRANVAAATPFRRPRDGRAALAFAVISVFVAGLYWPSGSMASTARGPEVALPDAAETPKARDQFSEEDLDYARELLEDLRQVSKKDREPNLEEFVQEVENLLAKAEMGELTKEELLEQLAKAEESFMDGADENVEESLKELKETGRELKKESMTREIGKALEQGDLEKAQQEMEKLAQKLENGELSEKEKEKAAKAMEKAAEKFAKKEEKQEQKADKQIAKEQKEINKLKRKLDQAKTEKEKERLSRRLEDRKRKLKKLQRDKEKREKSAQRRTLKSLHRNMKQASQQMQQKGQKNQKQASRKLRHAARDTGKVDSDRRKVATQKKVASQLSDLKEAMRRARRRGKSGMKDMFGKNRRNKDFRRRARGQKGSRGAWRPGQKGQGQQGQKPGQQAGNQPGGKGKQPGGKSYGDQHDPYVMGDQTSKSGKTKDQSVSGVQGRGSSRRETILSAAQKGFSSQSYKEVFAEYKTIVEEVIRSEKVPSGYKYYVKRYFQKIKPHSMD